MNCFALLLLGVIGGHAGPNQVDVKHEMFGLAANYSGSAGLAWINVGSGHAKVIFTFSLPDQGRGVSGLAYHPGTKKFYTTLDGPGGSYLGILEIDPKSQQVRRFVPPVFFSEGIEYLPQLGSLVISCTDNGYSTNSIAKLGLDGTLTDRYTIPVEDADNLGIEPETLRLLTFDTNNQTDGYSLNGIFDLLGFPQRVGLYNGPVNGFDNDLATMAGRVYLSRRDRLARFDNNFGTITDIGSFNLSSDVYLIGLAAAPRSVFTALPKN
ncbi:MAG: hypothetical protein HONBIEJF_00955 [Fimbriimonadaceae bacterium]|nr:hypothetical protein [Fimbriimonadaceae bacterium]